MSANARQVTNSEMETFKECRRRWYLSYYRRLTPRYDEESGRPARIGTLVHEAMESYYRGTDEGLVLQAIRDRATDGISDPKEVDFARVMTEGYFEWLEEEGADQGLVFDAVEERLEADSPVADVGLLGKIDLLATDTGTGELKVVDHKTTASFSRTLADIHILRQPKVYGLLRKINYPDDPLQGMVWNMIRTVKRGKTSKPPFYDRYPLAINDHELRQFWHELRFVIEDILRTEEQVAIDPRAAYPTPSKDCTWKCSFYGICGSLDDPRTDHEDFIAIAFRTYDPLERYDDKETTE